MQSDQFDKKIKEAAENHHPAYDEQAWDKMEKLLDKHLPQKKDDRRRFIFFLLLFLLLGGGAFVLISKPWKSSKTIAGIENKAEKNIPSINKEVKSSQGQSDSTNITNEEKIQSSGINENAGLSEISSNDQKLPIAIQQQINLKIKEPKTISAYPTDKLSKNKIADQSQENNPINISPTKNKDNAVVSAPVKNDVSSSISNDVESNKPITDKNAEKVTENKDVANNNIFDSQKKDETVATDQQKKKTNTKNKSKGFFAFSLSAGPDVSKAGSSDFSRVTLSYGAGVSYTLKKFTLRSGFYVAKKIYSANPEDYKLDYPLPPNIKLMNVDADCKVYEIPLGLTYNFGEGKNSNWYAGVGVSSYLMKSEKYNNLYKNTTSGSTYSWTYQYKSKNHNYFSVLDLSAGYTVRLNKTFSLSAEPYIKIPLQGVGEGKVHLNSAGILFSVGIKPFKIK